MVATSVALALPFVAAAQSNSGNVSGPSNSEKDYIVVVVRQIAQHFARVRLLMDGEVTGSVRVTLARDGKLMAATIKQSTGSPDLDNLALDAVRQAAPYPPFPQDLKGNNRSFLVPFRYQSKN